MSLKFSLAAKLQAVFNIGVPPEMDPENAKYIRMTNMMMPS